jgi:hypothetical protein
VIKDHTFAEVGTYESLMAAGLDFADLMNKHVNDDGSSESEQEEELVMDSMDGGLRDSHQGGGLRDSKTGKHSDGVCTYQSDNETDKQTDR